MDATENSKTSLAPHAALLAVQFFFGTATVLGKIALRTFPSSSLVGFRVAGATIAFLLLQKYRGGFKLDKTSHYFYFAFFSFLGMVCNQLFFFKGLSLTSATNAALLTVIMPIFVILVSFLIGNDKLSWAKTAGVITSAIGVIYLIDPSKANFSSQTTQGDLLLVCNSLFYATYVALSKKLVSHYGALKSMAWLFFFASFVNVPLGIYNLQSVNITEVSFSSWLAVLAIIIFPTILAYYFNAWALARVEPSLVAVYIYLQPLIGFILAITFLDERFSDRLFISALLIFFGVFLVTRKRKLQFAETNLTAD